MEFSNRWVVTPVLVAGWLWAAGPALALMPEVRDQAGFFQADTVKKANEVIRDIKNRFHKDLLIETFKNPAADMMDEAQSSDSKIKDKFFSEWAREQAHNEGVNGIYVLVCRDPPHVKVAVGNETRKKAFTEPDRDHLANLLVARFKDKKFDEGLLEGVAYVRDTMASNLKVTGGISPDAWNPSQTPSPFPPRKGPSIGGLLCIGLIGLVIVGLGFMVVMGLIRSVTGRMGGGYPGGGGPSYGYGGSPGGFGGGGGFLSSLFGSMFGAAAGNWISNSFFGGPSHQGGAWGGTGATLYSDSPPAGGGVDTDFSASSGGDFGDNSGAGMADGGGGLGDTGGGGDF